MLKLEQMKEQVSNYMIEFNEVFKEVRVTKGSGQTNSVKVSIKRAMEWIEVGIKDLDCRSKQEMLDLLDSWK
jgi:hypothetical protein